MKQWCPKCKGSGNKWVFIIPLKCKKCNGSGKIETPINEKNNLPAYTGVFAICPSCGFSDIDDNHFIMIKNDCKSDKQLGGYLERKCTRCNCIWKECHYSSDCDNVFKFKEMELKEIPVIIPANRDFVIKNCVIKENKK